MTTTDTASKQARPAITFLLKIFEQIIMILASLSGLCAFFSPAAWSKASVAFGPECPKNLAINNPALIVAAVAVVTTTWCLLEIQELKAAMVEHKSETTELNAAIVKLVKLGDVEVDPTKEDALEAKDESLADKLIEMTNATQLSELTDASTAAELDCSGRPNRPSARRWLR